MFKNKIYFTLLFLPSSQSHAMLPRLGMVASRMMNPAISRPHITTRSFQTKFPQQWQLFMDHHKTSPFVIEQTNDLFGLTLLDETRPTALSDLEELHGILARYDDFTYPERLAVHALRFGLIDQHYLETRTAEIIDYAYALATPSERPGFIWTLHEFIESCEAICCDEINLEELTRFEASKNIIEHFKFLTLRIEIKEED